LLYARKRGARYQTMIRRLIDSYAEKKLAGDKIDQRLVEHITWSFLRCNEFLQEKNADGTESLFWKMLMDDNAANKKNDG
jgi:hypothetical protein